MDSDDNTDIVNPDDVYDQYSENWYKISEEYWKNHEPSVSGMLDGFPEMSASDLKTSNEIIRNYQKKGDLGDFNAVDCGCGIGRVSKNVLSKYFKEIDLVDPINEFLLVAKQSLDGVCPATTYNIGLQSWTPEKTYDLFWIQWALLYLTDKDALALLSRIKSHMSNKGLIIIKDNVAHRNKRASKSQAQFRVTDNSVNRVYKHYIDLFKEAGLTLIDSFEQKQWDSNLLPLYTFVLK